MAKVAGEMSLADAPACFTISLRDDRELRAEINNVRTDVIGRIAKFGGGFFGRNCTSRDTAWIRNCSKSWLASRTALAA
jgi:hypothetical protein